ncbi:MAG: DUF4834 family protein [Parabacteroides sp.]
MFKFLFFMFFLFMLLLFLMGFSVLRSFKRFFFGESNRSENSRTQGSRRSSSRTEEDTHRSQTTQRKKIFTQEDGEYVDYEEVK